MLCVHSRPNSQCSDWIDGDQREFFPRLLWIQARKINLSRGKCVFVCILLKINRQLTNLLKICTQLQLQLQVQHQST